MKRTLLLAYTAIGVMALGGTAQANRDHKLNHVWSRLADINGEFGSVESAEFSPDSSHIVTGTKYDNSVRLFRTEDGHLVWKATLPAEIERVGWTADGQSVVSVSEDHYVRVIDATDGKILREMRHGNGIDSLSLSNDGRVMAVGEESRHVDGRLTAPVVLYDTESWKEIRRVEQGDTANEISFTPDDVRFVVAGAADMRIWNTETGRLVRHHSLAQLDDDSSGQHRFISTKVSPDGRYIVIGTNEGWLYFYDAKSGDFIRRLNKTGEKVETVEWTKDSKYILASGKSDVIDFFAVEFALDTSLGNSAVPIGMRVPMSDQLEYMHFNRSGSLLTTAHQDGTVQLWTYMSDNPGINQRSHSSLVDEQRERFGTDKAQQ